MLCLAESLLDPTARQPAQPPCAEPPPAAGDPGRNPARSFDLLRFYWHFIGQERWLAVALFFCGGLIAVLDASIPAFIGRTVALVSRSRHTPVTLLQDAWPQFALMAGVLLLVRPAVFGTAEHSKQAANTYPPRIPRLSRSRYPGTIPAKRYNLPSHVGP